MSDAQVLADLLRRLLDSGYWDTGVLPVGRFLTVDSRITDLTADEADAIERLVTLEEVPT